MYTPLARNMLRAAAGAALLSLASLPAGAQAPAPGAERPKPFAGFSGSAMSLRDSLVAMARAQVGTPYRLGGESPERGFDCSGLVQFIMSAFERDVPRTAAQQASVGDAIDPDTSRLRPGDLLTFGHGKRVSHVGIYIGNGRFVHASSVAGQVIESPIDRRAERVKPLRGVRRLIPVADAGGR